MFIIADRIKGISVEIGGETTGLQKALSSVNKDSRKLQSELKSVERLLKFDPNNVELLAQKQELLNGTIENTKKKLSALKQAQSEVQKLFESGDIGADEYRKFQRELAATEQSLRSAENAMDSMKEKQEQTKQSSQRLAQLFEVTGSKVEDYADVLGTRLVRAIQNGTASAKDLDRAFEKVGAAALGSADDIEKLKQSLQKLDSGEASVKKVRKEIQKLSQDAKDAKEATKGIGDSLAGAAVGVGAGAGVGAAVNKALEADRQEAIIEIAFEIPEESKAAVKDSTNALKAYGVEGSEALDVVRRQWALNGEATDAVNEKVIKSAGVITTAFQGIDLSELIQETSEMGEALGISQQSAMDMTFALLKMGFPPEQIDIIAEYGSQLSRAGYSAEQIQGILSTAVQSDSWNIDVLLDGLKEGRIRITEFGSGIDDTTAKMIEGTGISTKQLQGWGEAIAGGGQAGQQAMNEVALALAAIEDPMERNRVGTRLFGTLWEEQGDKITEVTTGAAENMGNMAENSQKMNDAMATLDTSSQVELNNALTEMNNVLMPLYTNIANFITQIATWISQNPALAAGIAAFVVGLGLVVGIIMIAVPIVGALTAASVALGIGMLPLIAIIIGVVAVIALIVAAIVYWKKNSDEIKAKIAELAAAAKAKFDEIKNNIKAKIDELVANAKAKFEEFKNGIKEKMDKAYADIKSIWDKVMSFFKGIKLHDIGRQIIQGLVNGINSMGDNVKRAAANIGNGIADKVKSILKLGSPSKLLMAMGVDTGEGMAIGLRKSLGMVKGMSEKMAQAATPTINIDHSLPEGITTGKNVTVNLHSPKALDVREANKQFRHTVNTMSAMW